MCDTSSQGETRDVHGLPEGIETLFENRAHVFESRENVLHIRNVARICVKSSVLHDAVVAARMPPKACWNFVFKVVGRRGSRIFSKPCSSIECGSLYTSVRPRVLRHFNSATRTLSLFLLFIPVAYQAAVCDQAKIYV